jgi:hypothetical protein
MVNKAQQKFAFILFIAKHRLRDYQLRRRFENRMLQQTE